jgi:uncharacterized protein
MIHNGTIEYGNKVVEYCLTHDIKALNKEFVHLSEFWRLS